MELKNLYSLKDFVNESKNEPINEGLFGFLKKMYKKLQDIGKKIKESGEIDDIINKSKGDVEQFFKDKADDIKGEFDKVPESEGQNVPNNNNDSDTNSDGVDVTDENKTDGVEDTELKKESKIFEEAETKEKIKEPEKNAIDEAIDSIVSSAKEQLKKYLESENKAVKFYAQAQISSLQQDIITKKIDIYKTQKGVKAAENKLKEEQDKLKEETLRGKESTINAEKAVNAQGGGSDIEGFQGTDIKGSGEKIVDNIKKADKKTLIKVRDALNKTRKDIPL